jgi:Protein of unknown function (DUF664)
MTSEPASQSIAPGRADDIPSSWDERTVLTTFLDYARDTVHAKCAGLPDADARRAPLPNSPLMTVSGLVSHLRWVAFALVMSRSGTAVTAKAWVSNPHSGQGRCSTQVQSLVSGTMVMAA